MLSEQRGDDLDEPSTTPEESSALEGKPMSREHARIKIESFCDRGDLEGDRPFHANEWENGRDLKRLSLGGTESRLVLFGQ